jgi:integrase
MAKSDHLWQRGGQWYLRLAIPRPLRQHFLSSTGKPLVRIVEPLGDSKSQAQIEAARRSAKYLETFERLKRGENLDDIKRDDAFREQLRLREQAMLERIRQVSSPDDMRRILALRSPEYERWSKEFVANWKPGQAAPPALPAPSATGGETVSQAAEALYGALERDGRRQTTVDGHKLRVRAFVETCGDLPLASITRSVASDWLDKIGKGRANRTRNAYSVTMALVIETARKRGRFTGENPFNGQKVKAVGASYQPFTEGELRTLFTALPVEVKPAQHTPETALPWIVRIAAYSGMRLEEIAQLTVADIKTLGTNGGTVVAFDIHNGDNAHHLKNESSARVVPLHSEIVRAGLLDYAKALPKNGPLFPGLKRRASKGDKVGARVGELFRKQLIALGLKREGLVFHSLRHNVATALEQAAVSASDTARVLGHAIAGESFGTYSTGPGLKRLAAVVEEIQYDIASSTTK